MGVFLLTTLATTRRTKKIPAFNIVRLFWNWSVCPTIYKAFIVLFHTWWSFPGQHMCAVPFVIREACFAFLLRKSVISASKNNIEITFWIVTEMCTCGLPPRVFYCNYFWTINNRRNFVMLARLTFIYVSCAQGTNVVVELITKLIGLAWIT